MEYQGVSYDAILVRGTPRFRANRKMVAADQVPTEVKQALIYQLQHPVEPTPVEEVVEAPAFQPELQVPEPTPIAVQQVAEAPQVVEVAQPQATQGPSQFELDLIAEIERLKEENAKLSAQPVAVQKDLFGLAQEMYSRYGIYTIFVNDLPKDGDIHPWTGDIMTRYETGLAYQSYNRAVAQGKLTQVNYSDQYQTVVETRQASDRHREEMAQRAADPFFAAPQYNTFAERTSVAGQNAQASTTTVRRTGDNISEDVTAEPNVRGTTIRPSW